MLKDEQINEEGKLGGGVAHESIILFHNNIILFWYRKMGNQCCQTDNTISCDILPVSDITLIRKAPLSKKQKQQDAERSTAKECTDDQTHKNIESVQSRDESKTQLPLAFRLERTSLRKSKAQDTKQGFHTFLFPDGALYEGYWKNDLQHGRGKFTYPNNDYYQGEWQNAKPNGKGVFVSTTGYQYEGGWVNGEYQGEGVQTYDNGLSFKGHFVKGKKNGFGRFEKGEGEYYEGEFKDDRFHGKGKYVWPTQTYNGEWFESQMHGLGQSIWSDGRRYFGNYSHGKKNGYGEFYWPDGRFYQGEWLNGKWIEGVYAGANGSPKKISKLENNQDKKDKKQRQEREEQVDPPTKKLEASKSSSRSKSEVRSMQL